MRRQRPRGTITRDDVVNAGLAVVDQVGVEGLTMRAVAQLAAAPTMSLYSHFKNKHELLDLMYVEVARRMYAYQGCPTWQAELVALAQRVHSLLSKHPNFAPLLSRPVPPLDITLREEVLKLMVADGMTPRDAFLALSTVALTSVGLVLVKRVLEGPSEGESGLSQRFALLKEWVETAPAGSTTQAALAEMAEFELDGTFRFAVQALIAGLEAKRA